MMRIGDSGYEEIYREWESAGRGRSVIVRGVVFEQVVDGDICFVASGDEEDVFRKAYNGVSINTVVNDERKKAAASKPKGIKG